MRAFIVGFEVQLLKSWQHLLRTYRHDSYDVRDAGQCLQLQVVDWPARDGSMGATVSSLFHLITCLFTLAILRMSVGGMNADVDIKAIWRIFGDYIPKMTFLELDESSSSIHECNCAPFAYPPSTKLARKTAGPASQATRLSHQGTG